MAILLLAGLFSLAIGLAFLLASFGLGPGAPAKRAAPTVASRGAVTSSVSGATPTIAATPVPGVAAQAAATSPARFSPAPPAAVQQVTPATGRDLPARSSSAPTLPGAVVRGSATPGSSASPQASGVGALVAALGAPSGRSPSASAAGAAGAIQNDLRSLNAAGTALAQQAGASASPAATDTPIPTAAPPIPPSA